MIILCSYHMPTCPLWGRKRMPTRLLANWHWRPTACTKYTSWCTKERPCLTESFRRPLLPTTGRIANTFIANRRWYTISPAYAQTPTVDDSPTEWVVSSPELGCTFGRSAAYAAVGRRTDATNQLHAMLLFAVGVRAARINRYVFWTLFYELSAFSTTSVSSVKYLGWSSEWLLP